MIVDVERHINILSGLSRHNKKCNYEEKIEEKEEDKQNVDYEKIINNLLTQNNEMLDKLLKKDEQLDKIIPLIGNNNNNTQFNINVFLNEDCKDALNLIDFSKFASITIEGFR